MLSIVVGKTNNNKRQNKTQKPGFCVLIQSKITTWMIWSLTLVCYNVWQKYLLFVLC